VDRLQTLSEADNVPAHIHRVSQKQLKQKQFEQLRLLFNSKLISAEPVEIESTINPSGCVAEK
jgi:hypothetical protein